MLMIGIDLGATFIKSGFLDLDSGVVSCLNSRLASAWWDGKNLDPLYARICNNIDSVSKDVGGILITGQMGGVTLVSDRSATPFSSWMEPEAHREFTTLCRRLPSTAWKDLGEVMPGSALSHLFVMAKRWEHVPEKTPLSLPDYVAWRLCGCPAPRTDATLAAATSLYSIRGGHWNLQVIDELGLGNLAMPLVVPHGTVIGEYRGIPVYVPIGDHQCALRGSFLTEDELSINVSTGSQVSVIADDTSSAGWSGWQVRPYFGGKFLRCFTHLPAGRMLSAFLKLFTEIGDADEAEAWRKIEVEAMIPDDADLRWDSLTCELSGARPDNLSVGAIVLAIFRAMAERYEDAAKRLHCIKRDIVLSGGLIRNQPRLRREVQNRFGGNRIRVADEGEALRGLLEVAREVKHG